MSTAYRAPAADGAGARVPNEIHERREWEIARIAPDFALLDVWALPVEGGSGDFGRFLEKMGALTVDDGAPTLARALFRARLRIGAALGWDEPKKRPIPGCKETSLRERLPQHLRDTAAGFPIGGALARAAGGFTPLYRTSDEAAAEISNETVHGVLHLTWVEQDGGRWRAHLAVYVKPRGRLGSLYMKLIEPFRHLIVYPALMRRLGAAWERETR